MMPEPERDLGGVRLVGAGEAINEWNLVFGEHESVDLGKQPREVDAAEFIFAQHESFDCDMKPLWGEAEAKAERDWAKLEEGRVARECEEIRLLIKEKHEKNARSVDGAYAFVVAVLFVGVVETTLVLMLAWLGEGYGIGTVTAVGTLSGIFAVVSLTLVYAFFWILLAIHAVLVQILDRPPPEPAGSAPVPIATGGSPSASASDRIGFYCPTGHHVSAPAKLAGKNGKCSKCNESFVVPSVSELKRPSGNARSLQPPANSEDTSTISSESTPRN